MSLTKNAIFGVLVMSVMGMVGTTSMAAYAQDASTSALSGSFASITTEQTGDKIVITITKDPGSTPADQNATLPEIPSGPIIIVPDPAGEGNGTVIVPEAPPAEAPSNETAPAAGNETAAPPVEEGPPVIVIEAPGNVTEVQRPSNVTVIDNDTVVITPPTDNITEIPLEPAAPAEEAPSNVTEEAPAEEAPAAGNATEEAPPVDEVIVVTPPAPEPCACPSEEAPPVAAEEVAPAGNETAAPIEPTLPMNETSEQPVQEPAEDEQPPEFNTSQPPEFFRS